MISLPYTPIRNTSYRHSLPPALPTRFSPFVQRMRSEQVPEIFIEIFAHYYKQLLAGRTGYITESIIKPVTTLPDATSFPKRMTAVGQKVLPRTVLIKLNGGLGTSMGLEQAKSLLEVKEGLTFLDIIAQQALQIDVPLLLMNNFLTNADSLALLQNYPELYRQSAPLSFLTHKQLKVTQTGFQPASWLRNPDLEWCTPGHGDFYAAMFTSRTLQRLIRQGYEYAFVSNADNLGAVIDLSILGYFAENHIPFMMEVTERTEMDRKGGHLARQLDGQLILRESAQCSPEDMPAFQDISQHKYFNTNNLWFHLPTLYQFLIARNCRLNLPMIRNGKTVDPREPLSTPVYQLETAIGSAISLFSGAQAVRVPRTRFAPVKKCNDLLAVRSDAYELTEAAHVVPHTARSLNSFVVSLDPNYYQFVDSLEQRFPYGAPSLVACQSLTVQGGFKFGKDVVCRGNVNLINQSDRQVEIPDGTVLEGVCHY